MTVAPLRPKGPPLNAMRAFEAAARLGSFVDAADELGVTPGAVSQHVKTLESWAGVALFRRQPQGVDLTSAGRGLVQEFTDAFDAIAKATHALRNLRPAVDVHIAALPSVAQLWLPGRLGKLRESFAGLRFSVTALEQPPSLTRDLFDLSIFVAEPSDGADQIALEQDELIPVGSPVLAKRLAADPLFQSTPLLHDQTWSGDWARWSRLSGQSVSDVKAGPRYSLYSLAVEEAKSGAGVLMGHTCLLSDALRSGDLVAISEVSVSSGIALVLNLPHKSRRRPEIDLVAEFLRDSVGPPD